MDFKNVSHNCKKEWYIYRSITLLIIAVLFVASFFIKAEGDSDKAGKVVLLIILGMVLIFQIIYAYVFPKLQYARLRYKLDKDRIERQSGVIFLRWQIVPFVRIQHIETFRGISDRLFNMSTVIIYTAGSLIRLPNLDPVVAEELVTTTRKFLDEVSKECAND